MIVKYDARSREAMECASRAPRPVWLTATLMTRPPNTNQNAVEWKPEKTTLAGATANSIAIRKYSTAETCSGNTPPANSPSEKRKGPRHATFPV